MTARELLQRAWRRIELQALGPADLARAIVWRLRGGQIGKSTRLPRVQVTWPHQVRIGSDCVLQPGIFFNFDHYWVPGPSIIIGNRVFIGTNTEFNIRGRIEVGDESLIAAGVRFIDHDHGIDEGAMRIQAHEVSNIQVGVGVWIGANAVILKGVHLGDGCVIGAGAVVTRSVPAEEIWAGVPGRRIGRRPKSS